MAVRAYYYGLLIIHWLFDDTRVSMLSISSQ